MPTDLDDLPFAARLRPLGDPLEDEGDYDGVLIEGDHADAEVRNARFSECALRDAALLRADLAASQIADVWMRATDLTGASLAESSWRDTYVRDSVLAGTELVSAQLRRVTFEGCKLVGVNFRAARLTDVVFRDCALRDCDLGGATAKNVRFPGSRVELALHGAELEQVDLREAAGIAVTEGVPALRGAIVNHLQLLELAPVLAASIGLLVRD